MVNNNQAKLGAGIITYFGPQEKDGGDPNKRIRRKNYHKEQISWLYQMGFTPSDLILCATDYNDDEWDEIYDPELLVEFYNTQKNSYAFTIPEITLESFPNYVNWIEGGKLPPKIILLERKDIFYNKHKIKRFVLDESKGTPDTINIRIFGKNQRVAVYDFPNPQEWQKVWDTLKHEINGNSASSLGNEHSELFELFENLEDKPTNKLSMIDFSFNDLIKLNEDSLNEMYLLRPGYARNLILDYWFNMENKSTFDWLFLLDNDSITEPQIANLYDPSQFFDLLRNPRLLEKSSDLITNKIVCFMPINPAAAGAGAWGNKMKPMHDSFNSGNPYLEFVKGDTKGTFTVLMNIKKYAKNLDFDESLLKYIRFDSGKYLRSGEDWAFGYLLNVLGLFAGVCNNIVMKELASKVEDQFTWEERSDGIDRDKIQEQRREYQNILKRRLAIIFFPWIWNEEWGDPKNKLRSSSLTNGNILKLDSKELFLLNESEERIRFFYEQVSNDNDFKQKYPKVKLLTKSDEDEEQNVKVDLSAFKVYLDDIKDILDYFTNQRKLYKKYIMVDAELKFFFGESKPSLDILLNLVKSSDVNSLIIEIKNKIYNNTYKGKTKNDKEWLGIFNNLEKYFINLTNIRNEYVGILDNVDNIDLQLTSYLNYVGGIISHESYKNLKNSYEELLYMINHKVTMRKAQIYNGLQRKGDHVKKLKQNKIILQGDFLPDYEVLLAIDDKKRVDREQIKNLRLKEFPKKIVIK